MNRKSANTWLTDMINISIERFKLLLNEINQIENKNSFIIIREDALLSKGSPATENVGGRCWGGARSMTGRDGQLIVNMTKTGCYYYYFIWIIKSLYRHVYEDLFFFSCGKSLKYSRHFWMCFLSSHAVSVNGAHHNNEAHIHKK